MSSDNKGSPSSRLFWVDIETTGLIPQFNRMLEFGMVITEADLTEVARCQFLVGPKLTADDIARMDPFIIDMHTKSGLLAELLDEQSMTFMPDEIDLQMCDMLDSSGFGTKDLMLAGSSVAFDRSWMEGHLPSLAKVWHYRNADTSGMREFFRRWLSGYDALEEASTSPKKRHRVMDDLDDSLQVAQFMRGLVGG